MIPDIETSRLVLRSLGIPLLELLLRGDRAEAARRIGCTIPEDYDLDTMPLERRLKQLREVITEEPWLVRAMIERATSTMIGHIGFHTPPRPEYLEPFSPGGVEMGYTVHPAFRRRGYAKEVALAMMRWAYSEHDQKCFVLSISPENAASNAMAKSLGFVECGSHMDEIDGLEIIFSRQFERWPADWESRQN